MKIRDILFWGKIFFAIHLLNVCLWNHAPILSSDLVHTVQEIARTKREKYFNTHLRCNLFDVKKIPFLKLHHSSERLRTRLCFMLQVDSRRHPHRRTDERKKQPPWRPFAETSCRVIGKKTLDSIQWADGKTCLFFSLFFWGFTFVFLETHQYSLCYGETVIWNQQLQKVTKCVAPSHLERFGWAAVALLPAEAHG